MSVLSLKNISFSYDKTPVLKDLSMEFEKGKMYCICGKSGAGKTTLLSILSGLASPTSGSIFYNDENIENIDKYKFRSKSLCARIGEPFSTVGMSIEEANNKLHSEIVKLIKANLDAGYGTPDEFERMKKYECERKIS